MDDIEEQAKEDRAIERFTGQAADVAVRQHAFHTGKSQADARAELLSDAFRALGPLVPFSGPEPTTARGPLAQPVEMPYVADVRARMTRARAERIRELRRTHTWRAVAYDTHAEWETDATWYPTSNQLAGMALTLVAGEVLGEDPNTSENWMCEEEKKLDAERRACEEAERVEKEQNSSS